MSRKQRILSICVLVLTAGDPLGAQAAPEGTADPSGEAAAIEFRESFGFRSDHAWVITVARENPVSLEWGVPLTASELAEMERRTGVATGLDTVRDVLEATPGYGGAYTDQRRAAEVVISFTPGSTPPKDEIEAALPTGSAYRVRTVDYTIMELRLVGRTVAEDMVAGQPWTQTIVFAGARARCNRVEIGIDPWDDNLAAELGSRYGASIVVVPAVRPQPTACVSRFNCPDPMKGGLGIRSPLNPTVDELCTSGFLARRTVFPQPNEWFMITAGHCIDAVGIGTAWFHQGPTHFGTGKAFRYYNAADVDAGIIKMTALAFPSNQVFASSPTDIRQITGVELDENQNEGDPVCRGAAYGSNNYACGNIIRENVAYAATVGVVIMHGWEMDRGTLGGGSGGPVMLSFKAYGIVGTSNNITTWYGSIDWVSASLGYRPCYTGSNNPC